MKLFYVAKTRQWGVDKDAVSCVAARDGKQKSLDVRDDGDSCLAEWFAEKVCGQMNR